MIYRVAALIVLVGSLAGGYMLRPKSAPVPDVEPPLLEQVSGNIFLASLIVFVGLIVALVLLFLATTEEGSSPFRYRRG